MKQRAWVVAALGLRKCWIGAPAAEPEAHVDGPKPSSFWEVIDLQPSHRNFLVCPCTAFKPEPGPQDLAVGGAKYPAL